MPGINEPLFMAGSFLYTGTGVTVSARLIGLLNPVGSGKIFRLRRFECWHDQTATGSVSPIRLHRIAGMSDGTALTVVKADTSSVASVAQVSGNASSDSTNSGVALTFAGLGAMFWQGLGSRSTSAMTPLGYDADPRTLEGLVLRAGEGLGADINPFGGGTLPATTRWASMLMWSEGDV